jgi:succinoglycan biosynthesis transport protein ExoP
MDQYENVRDSHFGSSPAEGARAAAHGQQFWSHLAAKLRGRYWLLAALMLTAGALGGALGWMHGNRLYRGEGIVLISNDSPLIHGALRGPATDSERFISTEASLMLERPVIEAALASDTWRNLVQTDQPMTVEAFARHVTVERPSGGQTVHVYFVHPDAAVAAAAVRALVQSYEADFRRRQADLESNDMAALQSQRDKIAGEKQELDTQIDGIVLKYGSDDLEIIEDTKLQIWQDYEKRAGELSASLVLAGSSSSPSELIARLTPTQIGIVDPRMARLLDAEDDLELRLQQYAGLGANHPAVIDARTQLDDARKRADDYAENFRTVQLKMLNSESLTGDQGNTNQNSSVVTALLHNVDGIRQKEQKFEQMAAQTKTEWMDLGHEKLAIEKIKEERGGLAAQIAELDQQIRAVALQNQIKAVLTVISYGDSPAPFYKDSRLPWTALCALAAMCIPFIILAKVALGDPRYRYSDEADAVGDGRPPLLGILPLIPERAADSEQAAVVAHCVHQIRVTLQLGHDARPSSYMVTSGTAGDGKTSLTVALGMSFASSGARTLLVDGDMVGQALTSRMAASTKPGAVSAMFTGTLNGSLQSTTIPNLYLLPLPKDGVNNPAGLSPQSVRDLLKQARAHFDVVLVDTGPVLGSIEASMVAGAVDGVILAVSRGQDRALISRALRQLRASGANITGMVFNRAERRDFHRSVASTSLRSVAKSPSLPRSLPNYRDDFARLGPLAACVASGGPSAPADAIPD